AMDGQSALEIAADQLPDIILLDIIMPGLDGYETCQRLKENALTREIPVIFVTARSAVEDESRGFAIGAVDYILKPFHPAIVKARVKTHLQLKIHQDELKRSISLLQHEQEVLQQEAELGLQAASLAHDLNNVLNVAMIIKSIPKLLNTNSPDKARILKMLGFASGAIDMGCDIAMGYASYLQNIGEEFRIQPVEPLLEPLNMYIREFKGKLEWQIEPDLPPINCKGFQLKRIFINLFVNAMQAVSPEADSLIIIKLWQEKNRVWVSITDNGPGIQAGVLDHIFNERFTTKEKGTGLGLFLVKQIVDTHGGSIDVYSDLGQGATFTLGFPTENSG
ncbi:MAG: response regulator, partial [SAR324 cluster bacterium]|nr:response regulator [SAR324 cluster bacterium]